VPHSHFQKQHEAPRRARAVAAAEEQQRMMRGLVNGLILSLGVWLVAGYLTFILH
jgi:hypothetical protein